MLAIGLSLLLLVFWILFGYALLDLCASRRSLLQNLLIAPAIGSGGTILPILWLNRMGLPVARFGVWLGVGLALCTLILFAVRRPVLPLRKYAPFAVALLAAFALAARPFLEFGVDWIGFASNDFGYYVAAAQRLLAHGFFDRPDIDGIVKGLDHTFMPWRLDVLAGHRPGSQLLLAWVSNVTGLVPYQAYMPTLMALHLSLISAVSGMAVRLGRGRTAALVTCLIVGASPIVTMGTMYQLIAQVWGLTAVAALVVLAWRPQVGTPVSTRLLRGAAAAIPAATLVIAYPEAMGLFGFATATYAILLLLRRRVDMPSVILHWLVTGVLVMVALNTYLPDAVHYTVAIVTQRAAPVRAQVMVFPFFLVPEGLAQFWGFLPLAAGAPEPWLTILIIGSAALLLVAAVIVARLAWGMESAAILSAPLLLLSVVFFLQRQDFLLFKIVLYLAPFLLATLAIAAANSRAPKASLVALSILAIAGLRTQNYYVEASRGDSPMVEVVGGSKGRFVASFRRQIAESRPSSLELDTINPVIAQLETVHLDGIPTVFPSRDFDFDRAVTNFAGGKPARPGTAASNTEFLGALGHALSSSQAVSRFPLLNGDPDDANTFTAAVAPASSGNGDCGFFGLMTRQQVPFNGLSTTGRANEPIVIAPCSAIKNHLAFVHSVRGQFYSGAIEQDQISLFKFEPDYFSPSHKIAGIGRHLLFRVINPTPTVRLVFDVTRSLAGDAENLLPVHAAAIGMTREPFGIIGRGSARVVSPPIVPRVIAGRAYVAIDMALDGQTTPQVRTGIAALFGGDIAMDTRHLTGFLRDVSVIGEDDYASLQPPSSISTFPADLYQPTLEYSGLYEDGWLGNESFVVLAKPRGATRLRIRAGVPDLGAGKLDEECTVLVNGTEAVRRRLDYGDFTIDVPADGMPDKVRIDLRFSYVQRLPGGDRRPTGAVLRSIGFER
jgi:hypothetical protein